uniref:NTP_transf_2 domain-containing protein n=1 Tax=Elaeophora elaphi TaxID=1147741 RepID=A0A0R3RH01_9BILA
MRKIREYIDVRSKCYDIDPSGNSAEWPYLMKYTISRIRITIATLQGGSVPQIGSQMFEFRESSDLDVLFAFLKHDTEYGKLCIREEPLTRGYTSMGRYVSGMSIEKCYFGKLKTKDYELSTYDMEASPYRFAVSSARTQE